MAFDTPIAFFLFNRPRETQLTLGRIAQIRPARLFLIADGPRGEADRQRCEDARAVARHIDWSCEVRVNFADTNLGCGRRVSSGLSWVFDQVDEAIILEDDCLADASFFPFCQELLERYRSDRRISMISGDNFQQGRRRTPCSYYFSMIPHVWGWATWRRSWRYFDRRMRAWEVLRETNWLSDMVANEATVARFYHELFDRGFNEQIDTWDIHWVFANFLQAGLTILPETNLVTNIGFGPDATHTRDSNSPQSNLPIVPMEFPLRHPPAIARNVEADRFTFETLFGLNLTRPTSKAA